MGQSWTQITLSLFVAPATTGFTPILRRRHTWVSSVRSTTEYALGVEVRSWEVVHWERPWTANAERRWHHHKRASMVRSWREAFFWLSKHGKVPRLDRATVVAQPLARTRRSLPDVGACYPAVKAAVDGIVDAGVLEDDDASHLLSLTFLPCEVVGRDGLKLTILEAR